MRARGDYTEITVVAAPGRVSAAEGPGAKGPAPAEAPIEITVYSLAEPLPTLIGGAGPRAWAPPPAGPPVEPPVEPGTWGAPQPVAAPGPPGAARPLAWSAPPGEGEPSAGVRSLAGVEPLAAASEAEVGAAEWGECPASLDLLGTVGEGAMGEVLLARDRALRRRVAYKRLREGLRRDAGIAQRLLAEAQITAQLDHPNVVPLHSLELHGDRPLGYVMKLVEGQTLAALIEQARTAVATGRPLPAALRRESLLEHFLKVCDAVAFAHAKGVIHRDLKPANIMVGRFNEVYVMDWGIARVLHLPDLLPGAQEEPIHCARDSADQGEGATVYGTLLGTPKYMSPEQARGELDRLDARSDLYSLGLILYELVCLRPAFGGLDSGPAIERVRRGERAPILAPSRRLSVPAELGAIVEKATRPEPADRYPSLAALTRDLRGFLRGESVSVLKETPLRRVLRWMGHHRQAVLSLFLATLLLAALATGGLWYRHWTTMQDVRDRRELTLKYLGLAAAQAQGIVQHFTRILGQLEGLSAGAELALELGEPPPLRIYSNQDFDSGVPPDLAPSRHYPGWPISTEQPVAFLPEGGVDPATLLKVRRLAALTSLYQRIFLESNGERDVKPSGALVRKALDQETIELSWLGIGLREGALVGYPGVGGFPEDYDPTRRPWYGLALPEEGRRVCGEPYLDAVFRVLNMPCSVALYSRTGELFGVAYLELPLAGSVAALLESRELPQARALLLNAKGQILLEVAEDRAELMAGGPLQGYGDEVVVEAARTGRTGLYERTDSGQGLWVIHIHLPELQWMYVTELYAWGMKCPEGTPPGTFRPPRECTPVVPGPL